MSQKSEEVITLDDTNDTVNLDSTNDDSVQEIEQVKEFVPVKPGGKLLHDETIELESDDEHFKPEIKTESPDENSHYLSSIQTPNRNSDLSKAQEANETLFQSFGPSITSSTPMDKNSAKMAKAFEESLSKHPMEVVTDVFEGRGLNKNAFDDLKDEFCESLEQSGNDNTTLQIGAQQNDDSEKNGGDSAISSPSHSHEHSKRERSSTTEEYGSDIVRDADLTKPLMKKRKLLEEGSDLPSTVTILRTSNGKGIVYLVGTAHFSKESNADVAHVIQTVQPDCVMLELCPSRTEILRLDEETLLKEGGNMSIQTMLATIQRYGKVQGIMYLLMLSMSAQLTKELGMAPGGEFRTAVKEASNVPGCIVHLGDRPIQVTMKRAFASLSIFQKIRMAFSILTSKETITKEEVEKCKQKDMLESMLEDMAGDFPELSKVFVDERDIYLSYTLRNAVHFPTDISLDNPCVAVGVVGIGHVEGIKKYWEKVDQRDVRRVISIPKPSKAQQVLSFVVKVSFYGAILFGTYKIAKNPIENLVKKITN